MFKIFVSVIFLSGVAICAALNFPTVEKPRGCSPRSPSKVSKTSSVYCVCNSTYCDDAPQVFRPKDQTRYTLISSSQGGLRFSVSSGNFGTGTTGADIDVVVDPAGITYQEILGFGGSMTDAAGMNIDSLSEPARKELLNSYFSESGLEYTILRVPMGASDFSPRSYSYAMTEDDVLLKDFALADEDLLYKIPYLRKAMGLNKRPIKLIASPWSGSPWMKTNNDWTGVGSLKREYWQMWGNYFVKFFKEYKSKGIDFWALTPQNEPLVGFQETPIASMGWTAEDQRDWLVGFLAPILEDAGLGDIDVIIGDGLRSILPAWPKIVMKDPAARRLVAGTGVHWYFDFENPATKLDETHDLFPEKYIIYTESCFATIGKSRGGVILGSWKRAEGYAESIIETISHWVGGWVDWNLALDLEGGPNWVKNFVDSPVIVNSTSDEFYKQPTFYVMGHFSKYVPPGSVRITTSNEGPYRIPTVGFRRPDNATAIVFLNTYSSDRIISVSDISKGTIQLSLPGKSIHTLIYW